MQTIKVLAPLLEAAGDFTRDTVWLVRSPLGGVGLYRNDTEDVQRTLPGPIASLAVSPAYPAERVAPAGDSAAVSFAPQMAESAENGSWPGLPP